MESLLIAYGGAWLAIAAYVGWTARQNARLARRLDELEALLQERHDGERVRSRAA
jgi:CcmD family protein